MKITAHDCQRLGGALEVRGITIGTATARSVLEHVFSEPLSVQERNALAMAEEWYRLTGNPMSEAALRKVRERFNEPVGATGEGA